MLSQNSDHRNNAGPATNILHIMSNCKLSSTDMQRRYISNHLFYVNFSPELVTVRSDFNDRQLPVESS